MSIVTRSVFGASVFVGIGLGATQIGEEKTDWKTVAGSAFLVGAGLTGLWQTRQIEQQSAVLNATTEKTNKEFQRIWGKLKELSGTLEVLVPSEKGQVAVTGDDAISAQGILTLIAVISQKMVALSGMKGTDQKTIERLEGEVEDLKQQLKEMENVGTSTVDWEQELRKLAELEKAVRDTETPTGSPVKGVVEKVVLAQ